MKTTSWMTFASEVRWQIERLPPERRAQVVSLSHEAAVTDYDYPGSLKDWDNVISSNMQRGRRPRTKPKRGLSMSEK